MLKLRWVIDANILGNVCREKNIENPSREFLDQVKKHRVLICKKVLNEYKPISGKKMCEQQHTKFSREWYTELIRKFGIKTKKFPDLPSCIVRQLKSKFKEEDCIYIQLALSNDDRLLVASETHFQNVKDCIERNNIKMFNEIEAINFLEQEK